MRVELGEGEVLNGVNETRAHVIRRSNWTLEARKGWKVEVSEEDHDMRGTKVLRQTFISSTYFALAFGGL